MVFSLHIDATSERVLLQHTAGLLVRDAGELVLVGRIAEARKKMALAVELASQAAGRMVA